jgi:hypothetical protein
MSKNAFFLIIFYIACYSLLSCAQTDNENKKLKKIKASAGAVAKSDGTIEEVNPSDEDLKSLQILTDKIDRINSQFPGPEIGHKNISNFFKVKNILSDSIIELENGERLGFAGCDCGDEFLPYLQITFSDKDSRVYYVLSGFSENDINYAYIWEINLSIGDDKDVPKEMIGPVFSQLNEAAMINKWCKPIDQPGHIYFERYAALSKIN